jgi:hypothetical protein
MSSLGFSDLCRHIGHKIECVGYLNADNAVQNCSIECMDCAEVLLDFERGDEPEGIDWLTK